MDNVLEPQALKRGSDAALTEVRIVYNKTVFVFPNMMRKSVGRVTSTLILCLSWVNHASIPRIPTVHTCRVQARGALRPRQMSRNGRHTLYGKAMRSSDWMP